MRFVLLQDIKEGMILGKNIYDHVHQVALKSGILLSERYIHKIRELGYFGAYIDDDLSKDIELNDLIDDQLKHDAFLIIKDVCIHAYNYSKSQGKNAEKVEANFQAVSQLALRIITDVRSRKVPQLNLLTIKEYDDFIVSHNVGVGILAIHFGQKLGLSTIELQRLGVAGLLIDLGKMFLDPQILNKQTKLSPDEFKQIEMHCAYGHRYLRESFTCHANTYLALLYHHERYDGKGYPKGKSAQDIPYYSRILAICDVYDALTSIRPNRPPATPGEAIEFIMASAGTAFDPELVTIFLKLIVAYPKGMEVLLSNGEKALIVENDKEMSLRPKVRILTDHEGKPISPKDISLHTDSNYKNVT
ncbi:MAG: HD-GYP domain-containing protein, partial [Vallitaleaceae bacterium]|nr:HD-GYP domain-containing protein [Vallitaleaceae bacterium]